VSPKGKSVGPPTTKSWARVGECVTWPKWLDMNTRNSVMNRHYNGSFELTIHRDRISLVIMARSGDRMKVRLRVSESLAP
jgi:hypothetical protein